MAGHRPAQRLVTHRTDGASKSGELLSFSITAPLHVNAVTFIAVVTFCEKRLGQVISILFIALRARIKPTQTYPCNTTILLCYFAIYILFPNEGEGGKSLCLV